jgi:hypothetical protein
MKYIVIEEFKETVLSYIYAESLAQAVKTAYRQYPQYIALFVREVA